MRKDVGGGKIIHKRCRSFGVDLGGGLRGGAGAKFAVAGGGGGGGGKGGKRRGAPTQIWGYSQRCRGVHAGEGRRLPRKRGVRFALAGISSGRGEYM